MFPRQVVLSFSFVLKIKCSQYFPPVFVQVFSVSVEQIFLQIHHGLSYGRCKQLFLVRFFSYCNDTWTLPSSFVMLPLFMKPFISPSPRLSKFSSRAPRASRTALFVRASRQSTSPIFQNDTLNQKVPCVYTVREVSKSESFRNSSPCSPVSITLKYVIFLTFRGARGAEAFCFWGRRGVFQHFSFLCFLGAVFVLCPLIIHFHYSKIASFSSSKTPNLRKKSRHKERAALRLRTRGPRGRKGERKQATCRFFVARSRRARELRRDASPKDDDDDGTLWNNNNNNNNNNVIENNNQKTFYFLLRRRRRRRLCSRTHGAKRMAENVIVHKKDLLRVVVVILPPRSKRGCRRRDTCGTL